MSAWPAAKALRPTARRMLRGASHTAAAAVVLLQKSVLNLRVDFVEPLFSAVSFILINSNLSLQLCDPIFGRSQLVRELLGHIERMFAVCFGHARGLVQQLQNGLPGSIELIRVIRSRIFRCKWNYGFCPVRTAAWLHPHFTPSACILSLTNFARGSPGNASTFFPSCRFVWVVCRISHSRRP